MYSSACTSSTVSWFAMSRALRSWQNACGSRSARRRTWTPSYTPSGKYSRRLGGIAELDMSRTAEVSRTTNETDLRVRADLDGRGEAMVKTGIGFFDHMLSALA